MLSSKPEDILKNLSFCFDSLNAAMLSFGDIITLIELSKGKKLIVELGVARGLGCFFLKGNGRVAGVDIFENFNLIKDPSVRDTYEKYFDSIPGKENYCFDIVSKYLSLYGIEIINSLTHLASRSFEDNSVGLLFIDADHSEVGIQQDYESWFSKIEKGGFILFHDLDGPLLKFIETELLEKRIEKIDNIIGKTYPTKISIYKKV
jgi:hypothetical protein